MTTLNGPTSSYGIHARSEVNHSETQDRFSSILWQKISQKSKEILLTNHFIYPKGLDGNYRYFATSEGMLIIDLISHLGHSRFANVCLGQNIMTGEFLAFKAIDYPKKVIDQYDQEVVAMRNLGRLRGLVCDEKNEIIYMATELIDGMALNKFYWDELFTELQSAFHLAIAYIKERQFLIGSGVVQSDTSLANIMVDIKKRTVCIIDFGGLYVFNHETKSFTPFEFDFYINSVDIVAIKRFFPFSTMNDVPKTDPLKEECESFLVSLEQMKDTPGPHATVFNTTLDEILEMLHTSLGRMNTYKV